jgi:hypothetical protein
MAQQKILNGGGTWKWIIGTAVVLIGVAVAYGVLNEKVDKLGKEMDNLHPRVRAVEDAVTGIHHDLTYIKNGIDRLQRNSNDTGE